MKTVTIIGGGLAGLTLGIGLRRRGVPVQVMEAGLYPRHRVCGEFISGDGLEVLERLDLREKLLEAGAVVAESSAFFSEQQQVKHYLLPSPALCLSRFKMDALLAKEFCHLGGELKQGTRWTAKSFGDGVVCASGRRVQNTEDGWRLFGLKVHARNVKLEADLEMHFRSDGYVGICRLGAKSNGDSLSSPPTTSRQHLHGGMVNICGLLRSRTALPGLSQNWKEVLKGRPGSLLHQRLEKAEFDKASFCSVAGLSLTPRKAQSTSECIIGDALTMIPPLTGNGMSMAFESAEQALDPLQRYSRGDLPWSEARTQVAATCDHLFRTRLFWANWTQRCLMQPFLRPVIFTLFSHSCRWSEWLFSKTR